MTKRCAVCDEPSEGLEYDGHALCNQGVCFGVIKYYLARKDTCDDAIHAYHVYAAEVGGKAGGAYLQTLGVTDVAKLSKDQWTTFINRVTMQYRAELDRAMHEMIAPE